MKFFWVLIGLGSLLLGTVGAFLPLLPTTPFILLSAFCFAKSSPKLHQWLYTQPFFGKIIREWEENKSISRSTKVIASLVMGSSFSSLWIFSDVSPLLLSGLSLMGVFILVFIWTRAEPSLKL